MHMAIGDDVVFYAGDGVDFRVVGFSDAQTDRNLKFFIFERMSFVNSLMKFMFTSPGTITDPPSEMTIVSFFIFR